MRTPRELDAVVDAVLAYKPKPKTKAAKRLVRRQKRAAKRVLRVSMGMGTLVRHWHSDVARAHVECYNAW